MDARRSAGRPTKAEAASIETQVLDAARNIFCEEGFSESSMDQIAQSIGASKLTIYRRYPSKEALLMAVVDRDIARVAEVMQEESLGMPTAAETLNRTTRRLFEFVTTPENLSFSRFIKGEGARRASIRDRFGEWSAAIQRPLIALIEHAQVGGQIRADVDSMTLAGVLIDLVDGIAERMRNAQATCDEDDLSLAFTARWDVFAAYSAVDRRST